MFLYELALELDVRSTALMDRAHALGIPVDPTAALTPDQVEQLRAAYGKGRAAAAAAPGAEVGQPVDHGAMGLPAIGALVAAGLVLVLLVGFMVTNSGKDGGTTVDAVAGSGTNGQAAGSSSTTEPCDPNSGIGIGAIGQGEDPAASGEAEPGDATDGAAGGSTTAADSDASLPPCDVVGGLSGDEIAAASTTFDGDPLDLPRDKREFCRASLGIVEFEMDMVEAAIGMGELGPILDVMIAGRDKFHADLTLMRESAPPRIDGPLDRYAVVYTNLLDTAVPGADEEALALAFLKASRTDLAYYSNQINLAVTEHCDKR